jgi:hypothetical protein
MEYKLTKPCEDCPFRKGTPMSLHEERVLEITDMMLNSQGGVFPCHKTVDYDSDEDEQWRTGKQHCAGALIFAEKHKTATQMMRIAERLGMYDARKVLENVDLVFDDVDEMLQHLTRES